MKAIKTIIMSMLLLAGLTTSCTNDIDEAASQSEAYLKIDVVVDGMTRGAIDATNFTKGDAIGVFVRDLEGKDYNAATSCSNIKATYDGSKWTLASKVPLTSGKEAVVYAYYPYNADAVITGDSIDIDITKQDDVLYGNATGVTANSPTAKINFKHALARITLAITKGTNDVGDGKLTNIRVENIQKDPIQLLLGETYVIATEGRMDFKTGKLKASRTRQDEIILNNNLSLSNTETKVDVLLVPFNTNPTRTTIVVKASPYVNLYLTIDGKEYKQIIRNPQWYAGQQYVYPITINRSTGNVEVPAEKVYMGFKSDNGKPLYWASYNLGSSSTEDYGGLYGWGDATGKLTSTDISQYPSSTPPSSICGTQYDTARQLWGNGWRMPSKNEWSNLYSSCDYVWEQRGETYGVKLTSKLNGNSIFLPYSPYRKGTDITWSEWNTVGGTFHQGALYWSGTLNLTSSDNAYCFYFDNESNCWIAKGGYRYQGYPIRPVTE